MPNQIEWPTLARVVVIAGCLLGSGLAPSVASIREAPPPDARLGLHIFGSTSRGDPLPDRTLAAEAANLGDCVDTRDASRALPASIGLRAADLQHATGQNPLSDVDFWFHAKFRCTIKDALGRYKGWRQTAPLEFVFMFNGGLNSQKFATDLARRNFGHILSERRYPLFMIWPTSGLDAYGESLLGVRAADVLKPSPLNVLTAVTQAASDMLRGVAGLPKTFENGVRYNTQFAERISVVELSPHQKVDSGAVITEKRNVAFSASVDDEPPPWNPVAAALSPVRPAAMALSDIGVVAWSNMVRRSRTAIHNTAEYRDVRVPHPEVAPPDPREKMTCVGGLASNPRAMRDCFPSGAGAFSRFFHWYQACAYPDPAADTEAACPLDLPEEDRLILRSAQFTMVGHSMGAIVINEIVSSYPRLPFRNVVFMAGADSVRSTRKTLAPLLVRNEGCTRFYNLMLHPENDQNEAMGGGPLPKGSLLEYIDHYLDPPKTVDDRTIGKWVNVFATRHMFSKRARKWMLLQVFDLKARPVARPAGRKTGFTPVVHGGFNDDGAPFWSEDFWNPEKVAFSSGPSPTACQAIYRKPD